jgi:Peptidase family M23
MLLAVTTTRRLALLLFVFLAWTPAAYAWSWPVQGPVLHPFAYDEAHPYAAGQHRGIDIGADTTGETVVAPAAGTVSFAGTVPTNGKTVTIETADGYSVTLTHLGSIAVGRGATVVEQDAIGAVGPSGTPEVDGPYVHLGIRVTADQNGYVDPLSLLPSVPESGADESSSTASQPASQPVSTGTSSAPPAGKAASPAPRRQRPADSRGSSSTSRPSQVRTHEHQRVHQPRSEARTARSPHRVDTRVTQDAHPRASRDRVTEQPSSFRRPFVEPAAPQPSPDAYVLPRRGEPSSPLLALVCNWTAALFALGAALLARRRRCGGVRPEVLRLPLPEDEVRRVSRAA